MQALRTIVESTSILYHTTSVVNADKISTTNNLELTFSAGTGSDNLHHSKWFYFSCSHSKIGGYAPIPYKYSVTLVMDGTALGQRYTIRPCQYWGDMKGFTTDQRLSADENEERVWSHQSTIKPASRYVKSAHVLYSSDVGDTPGIVGPLNNLVNSPWPVYFYTDKQAFLVQDIRKSHSKPVLTNVQPYEPYVFTHRDKPIEDLNTVISWMENPNSDYEAVKELALKRAYYFDFYRVVECDVHNLRSYKTPEAQAALQRLGKVMRRFKAKSVKEMVANAQARMK